MASQISDHMPSERFLAYGNVFCAANLLRDIQLRLPDDYAVAMTGRHPLPPDTKTLADELTAVERLRTNIIIGRHSGGTATGQLRALEPGITALDAVSDSLQYAQQRYLELCNARSIQRTTRWMLIRFFSPLPMRQTHCRAKGRVGQRRADQVAWAIRTCLTRPPSL